MVHGADGIRRVRPRGRTRQMVDYRPEDDSDVQRVRADTDPHNCPRADHEGDAWAGFAALAGPGKLTPAAPPLKDGQMIRAAADALGGKVSRIPGDDEPLTPDVTVRIVGAAAGRPA